MKTRALCLFALLALPGWLAAQDPALRDTFQQAKTLWASDGNLAGAAEKFEQVLGVLAPKGRDLDPEWLHMLCETYNWMAILDDRVPAKRAKAAKDLELLLDLNPDFEIDRNVTNSRLQTSFDNLRAGRFCRVKVTLAPEGGVLTLDGKPRTTAIRWLPVGPHVFTYVRPGYQVLELKAELAAKETRNLDLTLTRTSSTITLHTSPVGAEVWLDGKQVGVTSGTAPAALKDALDKARLRTDQVSGAFVLDDLAPRKHTLEIRKGCFRPRTYSLGEEFTTPMADHTLEPLPIVLEPSQGTLTVTTSHPGGELVLSGRSAGPVPVKDLSVCAGAYDLVVRFPAGGFSQKVDIQDRKSVEVVARPKPRLAYVGLEGSDEFVGRERFLGQLANLGARLREVAFQAPAPGETPQAALARVKGAKDAELILTARPVPGKPIHQVELVLSTLAGEEERFTVKPLESDPLEGLVRRLNTPLVLSEPWAGIVLVDLPGETNPVVVQADAAATKAGVRLHKPLLTAGGKAVTSAQAWRKLLREASGERIAVSQGEAPIQLPVSQQVLELPLDAASISYPFALVDLKIKIQGARGDEANFLRLEQGLALMHYRQYDRALEVLRDARVSATQGVCQGTIDYYTGICLLRLGSAYTSEAIQAFNQALKVPGATLFGPDGPLLAPLAKQALEDLKP